MSLPCLGGGKWGLNDWCINYRDSQPRVWVGVGLSQKKRNGCLKMAGYSGLALEFDHQNPTTLNTVRVGTEKDTFSPDLL